MNGGPYLEHLSPEECVDLLSSSSLGRVGATIDALPVIVPVRFALHSGNLIFRVACASRLHRAAVNQVIVFQADHSGEQSGVGWTVHVQDFCQEVTSPEMIDRLQMLPLPPWHRPDSADTFVRLGLDRISGQRVYW